MRVKIIYGFGEIFAVGDNTEDIRGVQIRYNGKMTPRDSHKSKDIDLDDFRRHSNIYESRDNSNKYSYIKNNEIKSSLTDWCLSVSDNQILMFSMGNNPLEYRSYIDIGKDSGYASRILTYNGFINIESCLVAYSVKSGLGSENAIIKPMISNVSENMDVESEKLTEFSENMSKTSARNLNKIGDIKKGKNKYFVNKRD